METGFYVIYLIAMMATGIYLLIRGKKDKIFSLFGTACFILAFGDAFHLIPRAVGLFTNTLDSPDATLDFWLGIGKFITSLTMTLFYLFLYLFIYRRSGTSRTKYWNITICALTVIRLLLCSLPQNEWLTNQSPLTWGIIRNVPFVIHGVLIMILCFQMLRTEKYYRWLWLAIAFSFAFYIPVVILAAKYSWVGMLMLPKTICYLWIASMGLRDYRNRAKEQGTDGEDPSYQKKMTETGS